MCVFAHTTLNAAGGLLPGLSMFVTTKRLNSELTTGSSGCGNQRAALKNLQQKMWKTAAVVSNLLRIVYFSQLHNANIPPQPQTVVFQSNHANSQYYSFQSQLVAQFSPPHKKGTFKYLTRN